MLLELKHSHVLQVWGEALCPPHAALGSGAGERDQTSKQGQNATPVVRSPPSAYFPAQGRELARTIHAMSSTGFPEQEQTAEPLRWENRCH